MGAKSLSFVNLNKNQLPHADLLSGKDAEFSRHLRAAAQELARIIAPFQPDSGAIRHWDNLIREWSNCDQLPLYIRKTNNDFLRGAEVVHQTQRLLIPCDNGPAHWIYSMCANENLCVLEDIPLCIESLIPVAMMLGKKERHSKYRITKHEIDSPNKKGWKLAHRVGVGLNTRKPLNEIDISDLREHFVRLMSPSNMFLVPLQYAGLAETKEFIEAFGAVRV